MRADREPPIELESHGMFGSKKAGHETPPTLFFKSTVHAFTWSCKYSRAEIALDEPRIALIRGEHVLRFENGSQSADLYIAGDNDYFLSNALLHPPRAPPLKSRDLVLWVPREHLSEVAKLCQESGADARIAWQGIIVAKLKPELDTKTMNYHAEIDYSDYF
jgi:hypothetical protein